jgi:hypothetical protein
MALLNYIDKLQYTLVTDCFAVRIPAPFSELKFKAEDIANASTISLEGLKRNVRYAIERGIRG